MQDSRFAKIVATLGPSSSTREQISKLVDVGVNVFRLNFSHGSHDDHRQRVQIIRELQDSVGHSLTILQDLQGPKIRVGLLENGKVSLRNDREIVFDQNPDLGNADRICLPHPEIFAAVKPGSTLLVDDGKIRLEVLEVSPKKIRAKIVIGGVLQNRKGVNVPDVLLPIAAITEKDAKDLEFGLSLGVDWVALSFVQKPEDLILAREIIQDKALLIAKLEKPQAIESLAQIVGLSDGIMVARGDLGVEMPPEDVPVIQRQIISECRKHGKPVIVATQMMESMIHSPTPTRAEASDVATAIYEGADAVMLSAESASGDFPVESVQMMSRVIRRVERDPNYRNTMLEYTSESTPSIPDAMSAAVENISATIDIKGVIVFTATGYSAFRIAKERPKSPILALTPNTEASQKLNLVWGLRPVLTHEIYSFSQMIETACREAIRQDMLTVGDRAIIIAGVPFGSPGGSNVVYVAEITDEHVEKAG